MRGMVFVPLLLAFTSIGAYSQSAKISDWPHLVDANKRDAAQKLCSSYVDSPKISEKVEAQKCLTNVALMGNDIVLLDGNNAGGGELRGSYTRDAVDAAIKHLDIAMELAPQDLSIHQGRLHILEVSGSYSDMVKALDQSCTIYKGADAVEAWLAYVVELDDLGQYRVALDFSKVIDKHYPNNPDVVGNIGAFLMMLNKPAEGIPYLQRAVSLSPKDPINSWDLGRAYDLTNHSELADKWYRKGLSLETDKKQLAESSCIYGNFVDEKLHNRERACDLEKKYCAPKDQRACGDQHPMTQK
jgi:tetratricopeptide (TPR) repeat protein